MTRLENMTLFLKECEWDAKREPFATVLWHLAQAERELADARAQLREEQHLHTATLNERDRLAEALREIKNELGVPQPEYPAPVANAVRIADEALAAVKGEKL
jgi:hypothetical protein